MSQLKQMIMDGKEDSPRTQTIFKGLDYEQKKLIKEEFH